MKVGLCLSRCRIFEFRVDGENGHKFEVIYPVSWLLEQGAFCIISSQSCAIAVFEECCWVLLLQLLIGFPGLSFDVRLLIPAKRVEKSWWSLTQCTAT